MRRLTITVDDELFDVARAAVKAGRAASVSAWVAEAMREKARARAELLADIDQMRREDPTTPKDIDFIAKVLGRPASWVEERLAPSKRRSRRAG